MKKPIFILFVFIFILSSCAMRTDLSPLSYQASGAEISGVLRSDTGDVRLSVTLLPLPKDSPLPFSRDAVLTFSYGSGIISAKIENGKVTLSANGLSVPVSDSIGKYYLTLSSLFAIDEGALYSAEADGDGNETLSFSSGSGDFTVTLDPLTSLPKRITAQNGEIIFEIDEYRLSDVSDASEDET